MENVIGRENVTVGVLSTVDSDACEHTEIEYYSRNDLASSKESAGGAADSQCVLRTLSSSVVLAYNAI